MDPDAPFRMSDYCTCCTLSCTTLIALVMRKHSGIPCPPVDDYVTQEVSSCITCSMKSITLSHSIALPPPTSNIPEQATPFSQQWVTITKEGNTATPGASAASNRGAMLMVVLHVRVLKSFRKARDLPGDLKQHPRCSLANPQTHGLDECNQIRLIIMAMCQQIH